MPMAEMLLPKSEVTEAVDEYLVKKYGIKMIRGKDGSVYLQDHDMLIKFEVKEIE